jgi:hypothetical protein
MDDGDAFVPDIVRHGGGIASHASRQTSDDEAEAAAEEFIASAISGEDAFEEARDEPLARDPTRGSLMFTNVRWVCRRGTLFAKFFRAENAARAPARRGLTWTVRLQPHRARASSTPSSSCRSCGVDGVS